MGGDPRLGPPRGPARGARRAPRGTPFASVEDAVAGARVVCIATPATEPVLPRLARPRRARQLGRLLDPGRELDPALGPRRARRRRVARVRARPAALRQHRPRGRRSDPSSASSSRPQPGRTSPEQLTLYKSVGVAVEDDAAAALALRGAEERELGTVVEL